MELTPNPFPLDELDEEVPVELCLESSQED